jgi:hypothetical protein
MARPLENENSRVSDVCDPKHSDPDQTWHQAQKGCGCQYESSTDDRNKGNISDNKAGKRVLLEQ